MRSTACPDRWRRCCIRRSRTSSSTSSWARGRAPAASAWTSHGSRWLARRPGPITLPLRERFGFSPRLDYYSRDDLARIVRRSAGILHVALDGEGASEISRRSRGTPRVANRLLRRVRDFAEVRHDGAIDAEVARRGLELFDVDEEGLEKLDLSILSAVIEKFGGGPVGLSTLAAAVGEETDTVEDVYEPYLLQLGLLKRTPRGRVATERAYSHLGLPVREPLPLS